MLSYYSLTYIRESFFAIKNKIKSKERKVLTNETIAACVSLRRLKFNKNNVINL
jgi:hypothetical protein